MSVGFIRACRSKACLWMLQKCGAQLPFVGGKGLPRRLDSGQLLYKKLLMLLLRSGTLRLPDQLLENC